MSYVYVLLTVVFTVTGQMIIKWRTGQLGTLPQGFVPKISFLLHCLLDPYILAGFVAAFFASLMWIAAMTRLDLSQAYPFVTAGLTLLTVMGGIYILGEPLTTQKIAGVGLICAGVVAMSLGS